MNIIILPTNYFLDMDLKYTVPPKISTFRLSRSRGIFPRPFLDLIATPDKVKNHMRRGFIGTRKRNTCTLYHLALYFSS